MVKLENKELQIELNTLGAELTKVYSKETKLDYLWNGDSKFWKRQAPILFPFVGKLKEDSYFVDNKSYELSQHGFARDAEFEITFQNDSEVIFELSFSQKILLFYPFKFQLIIHYKLIENQLQIKYSVINKDVKDLYFSIGAHPAFKCPLTAESKFSDYYIEFEYNEKPNQFLLNQKNGLRIEKPTSKKIGNKLELDYALFAKDALIFKDIQSKKISLKSNKHHHGIDFEIDYWQFFAFWTKQNASFLCFEPWMGAADLENTDQNFKTKDGILQLAKNEEYHNDYKIRFY